MKQIKSVPRFRCDFCKKTGTKHSITVHEKRCFRNPDRFCDFCDNTGKIDSEYIENYGTHKIECPYCSLFNKKQLEEIKERENATRS